MPKTPRAAAVYARISMDRSGGALGIKRQLADCHAEAERRGWVIAEDYVDNDTSAYSGKARPDYQRMMDDIAEGLRDGVLVYHLDRLHRRPKELEEFVESCDRAGVKHVATVQGDVNLGNADGLFVARIMGAVAAAESGAKSRRAQRKMLENAQAGKPHGTGNRPFGYEPGGMTLREPEAAIIRDLVDRLLAGESLASLTNWLNSQGIPTVTGRSAWRTGTVRAILASPRISGQRIHKGEIIGPGLWPAIITPEQTSRIRALFDDPTRRTNRTARRYLLSGMLRCAECGATLLPHPRKGVRRYICRNDAERRGCGKIAVTAQRVEELITEGVLLRLDSPELAAALTGDTLDRDGDAEQLRDAITSDRQQLDELAAIYATGTITAREWIAARDPIEARITAAERNLGRLTNTTVLNGYLGNSTALRTQWDDLNLGRRRAIIAAVLGHAIITRAAVAGGAFDYRRVQPVWRI